MRARGPRGTHGLVGMVREQVKVLTETTGRMSKDIQVLKAGVQALAENVSVLDTNALALGKMLEAVAEAVDAQGQVDVDHEERLRSIEKQLRERRGR